MKDDVFTALVSGVENHIESIYQRGHTNDTEFGYLLYTKSKKKFNVTGIAFCDETQRN
jgi:hypothetical protein